MFNLGRKQQFLVASIVFLALFVVIVQFNVDYLLMRFSASRKLMENNAETPLEQHVSVSSKEGKHTCDFKNLRMPIRVQDVSSGTGVHYKMFLHPPNIDSYISEPQWNNGVPGAVVFEGNFHPEFVNSIERIRKIKNQLDLIIVDIGANIGVHSMFFSSQGIQVHSFEPSKANFRLLQCSAFINDFNNLVLNNVALSNVATGGEGWCISTPDNNNQGHKVLTQDCGKEKDSSGIDDKEDNNNGISTIPLDDYWTGVLKMSRVDMIKIDIEGHEPLAFAGAHKMFREAPPYIIYAEFQPVVSKAMGWDPVEFLQTLWNFGYSTSIYGADIGFKTRNINDVDTAKELVAYCEELTSKQGLVLVDMVYKYRDFVESETA